MVAGRQTHPYIMSLSYGSPFISTSAIIGFGGAAAVFGMGLIWLAFLVTILVSLVTEKLGDGHLRHCFEGPVTAPHAPAPDEAIEPELDRVSFE